MEKAISTHVQDCLKFMSLNVCGPVSDDDENNEFKFEKIIGIYI